MDQSAWYVVETHRSAESICRNNLERQNFRGFCPQIRRMRSHARRKQIVLVPLFPRYVFVLFSKARDAWHSIKATRGVKNLICSSRGDPIAVPSAAMQAIFDRCEQEIVTTRFIDLSVGQEVRIGTGPFAERIARVIELGAEERVNLLIEFLGTKRPVQFNAAQIFPLAGK